jgi:hypothetical protein
MNDMGTLRFRNLAQKVLWDQELSGQISDGRWENSKPYDHWEYWHRDVTVVVDPENVGRDFWVKRDGYCFTEKELLETIGERMLEAVQVATGNAEYSEKDMLADLRDMRKIIKLTIPANLPVPSQPEARTAKLVVEGFPQNFTVYVDTPDDPRAVQLLAEREQESARYRVERLEKEYKEARAKADEVGLRLSQARVDAGMLPV